jgi:hypothetical protein
VDYKLTTNLTDPYLSNMLDNIQTIISKLYTIILDNNDIVKIYKQISDLPIHRVAIYGRYIEGITYSYDFGSPEIDLYLTKNTFITINILEEIRNVRIDSILK